MSWILVHDSEHSAGTPWRFNLDHVIGYAPAGGPHGSVLVVGDRYRREVFTTETPQQLDQMLAANGEELRMIP